MVGAPSQMKTYKKKTDLVPRNKSGRERKRGNKHVRGRIAQFKGGDCSFLRKTFTHEKKKKVIERLTFLDQEKNTTEEGNMLKSAVYQIEICRR